MNYCPLCERTYGEHLAVCPEDGATLRKSALPEDSLLGHTIKGRYRVLRKLGAGGMGAVYLAEQVSIDRKVALKVLRPDFASDSQFVHRFRREARLAAALNHRNVVTIYEFDQAEDGSLFIAMEYLQGRTLGELIQQDSVLPVGRAVRLGLQIAQGLEAAHRAGVIHRDIKPQNIMVGPGDEVKLMDFGIARLADAAAPGLTTAGVVIGTPGYMAPEQIEGKEITKQTDIYAFGVLLYEMLTGSVPFTASSPRAVLTKHLCEIPVPVGTVNPKVPPSVERVVMQALEKAPQARQRDMAEAMAGLQGTSRQATEDMREAALGLQEGGPQSGADPFAIPAPPAGARWKRIGGGLGAAVLLGGLVLGIRFGGLDLLRPSKPIAHPQVQVVVPEPPVSMHMEAPSPQSVREPAAGEQKRLTREAETPPRAEEKSNREGEKAQQQAPMQGARKPPGILPLLKTPQDPAHVDDTSTPPKKPSQADLVAGAGDTDPIRVQIEQALRNKGLLKEPGSKAPGVTVKIRSGGIVTLTGVVRDHAQRLETVRATRGVPGVTEVREEINVQGSWGQSN